MLALGQQTSRSTLRERQIFSTKLKRPLEKRAVVRWVKLLGSCDSHKSAEDLQELTFMGATDIYCQAIKRTFADLYGVAHHEVDVSWNKDGDYITVRCADKTFTHETIHDDDCDCALEFVSTHEDPVTVRLTNDERLRLERADLDRLNGF